MVASFDRGVQLNVITGLGVSMFDCNCWRCCYIPRVFTPDAEADMFPIDVETVDREANFEILEL